MRYVLTGEQTERLDFHLLTRDYFEAWVPMFDDTSVAGFLGMDPSKPSRELCEYWFEKSLKRYEENRGGMNVLIDRQTGAFVGQCGLLLQTIDGEDRLEVGYSVLPQYWGKGYATEAARRCKELAFERNYCDVLISIVHPDNHASAQVARNNGMSIERFVPDFAGMPVNIYRVEK